MARIKNFYTKLNRIFQWLDQSHLEWVGIVVVGAIMAPILILGKGAVFPIHDQLDETILNYLFTAHRSENAYAAMMCGAASSEGLKPFAPLFVPLYRWFDLFEAFVIQYFVVIATAFWGLYFCVKNISKSSIAAFMSASVFTLLPYRSVYGNLLSGTPLLIVCVLGICKSRKLYAKLLYSLGIIYYALSTSLMLVGYAAIFSLFICFIYILIVMRKAIYELIVSDILLGATYLLLNIDVVKQVLGASDVISHREEFRIQGTPFLTLLKQYLFVGVDLNESLHQYVFIAVAVALIILILNKPLRFTMLVPYMVTVSAIILLATVSALLGSEAVGRFKNGMHGMIRSFQAQRFYLLLPGLWYILLGISLAIIIKGIGMEINFLSITLAVVAFLPSLLFVGKNKDCIFYQNVNQINNPSITGYITWEKLYAEELMQEINETIGLDKSTYRVGNIGISPVVSLMSGFYTIDGYSNNYSLEYKHEFAKVIDKELELNDFCKAYFYDWGNRCYLFSHEFGNAAFVGKASNAVIMDFCFDVERMKSLGCKYIFSAARIEQMDQLGLSLIGVFEDDGSFWRIWVYEL